MTTIRRDGLTWVAPRDGLAHATPTADTRALCGTQPTPDRYAWPIREFCVVCLALEDGLRAEKRRAGRKARVA